MLVKAGIGIAAAAFIGLGVFALPVTVERLPDLETMPILTMPAYIMAGIGGSFLLIVLWRLVTLRVPQAFVSLLASVVIAYYPLAYLGHYSWFTFYGPEMVGRALEPWEDFIQQHWSLVDYAIMVVCVFLGVLFLSFTMRGNQSREEMPPTERSGNRPQYIPNLCSPGIAVVLSFFYPGLGQLYAGRFLSGFFIMVWPFVFTLGICFVVPVISAVVAHEAKELAEKEGGKDVRVTVVPLISSFVFILVAIGFNILFYIWNLYDAYQGAEYANDLHRTKYG